MFILPNSHKFPQLFSTSAWFPRRNCIKPCIPWPQHFHQWCWCMPSYSSLLGWCSTLHICINLSLQDHACGVPLPWILMMATNEPSWLHIGSDWRLDSVQKRLFVFLIYMCEALCLLTGPLLTENPCLDLWIFFDMLGNWASYWWVPDSASISYPVVDCWILEKLALDFDHTFISAFLLRTYCVSCTLLGIWVTLVNEAKFRVSWYSDSGAVRDASYKPCVAT